MLLARKGGAILNTQTVVEKLSLEVVAKGREDVNVEGAIAGDLLSFVMASAKERWVWITVQTHLNIAAVAVLKDIPLIIVGAGRRPVEDLIERCREEQLTLACSPLPVFEICGQLYEMGLRASV
jgi:hypothetical protein